MPIPQNGVFFLFIMYIDTNIISYRRIPLRDWHATTHPPLTRNVRCSSTSLHLWHTPNMKRHHVGVFSWLVCFLHPLMHTKHEKTPALVSFCAWHPSTSMHPRRTRKDIALVSFCAWCIHSCTYTCQTQKDTNVGVFSCSAPVPGHLVSGKRGLPPRLSLFGITKRPVPSSSIYLLLN